MHGEQNNVVTGVDTRGHYVTDKVEKKTSIVQASKKTTKKLMLKSKTTQIIDNWGVGGGGVGGDGVAGIRNLLYNNQL